MMLLGMSPSLEDLRKHYEGLSLEELIWLARAFDSLTPAAQTALQAEFARRSASMPLSDPAMPEPLRREWITVCRYRDLSAALVAQSALESAGITSLLRDTNLIRLEWQLSNFIGGIRLQVEAGEESAAAEILSVSPVPSFAFAQDVEFLQPACPICHSLDIAFQGPTRGVALIALYVASIPLPLGAKTWLCSTCGARWEDDTAEEQS